MPIHRPHFSTPFIRIIRCLFLVAFLSFTTAARLGAQEVIKFSCSNQVYQAFEIDNIRIFSKDSGIRVDVFTASSGSAVFRLMNGTSDVAATARPLYQPASAFGFDQIPFCKDPIAVIVRADFAVENITEEHLKDIFSGKAKNWKAVGGPDRPIVIIVPDWSTAAYKNFHNQILIHKTIEYDFTAQNAAMVVDAVKSFPPGAVSFISQGAAVRDKGVKALKINGYAPREVHYPYYQTFYYITRKAPSPPVRKFIDFTFSSAATHIIIQNGMLPIIQQQGNP